MATVIFYNFILLSSTFFVWLSERMHYKLDRWFLLGIAFLLVFVPAAIRYDIGTDYVNYLAIYEGTSATKTLEPYKFKEPFFYFVNWFLRSIGAHFQWMFATFAFIFTAVAFKAYPKKNAWLLHFLFFSMLWFFSFNGMRQAVALAWCLLAMFNFFERKYFAFFVLSFIGATFHQSALLITFAGVAALIPLGSIFKSRDRKSTRLNSSHVRISYAVFFLKKKMEVVPALAAGDEGEQPVVAAGVDVLVAALAEHMVERDDDEGAVPHHDVADEQPPDQRLG